MRVENGANIRFFLARSVCERLFLVPRGHGGLADGGLVRAVVHVEGWLHHNVNARLLRALFGLSNHTVLVAIDELGLNVNLLADEIGVSCGIGEGSLVQGEQLIYLLHKLSTHRPGLDRLRDGVKLDDYVVGHGLLVGIDAGIAVQGALEKVLTGSEPFCVHRCAVL